MAKYCIGFTAQVHAYVDVDVDNETDELNASDPDPDAIADAIEQAHDMLPLVLHTQNSGFASLNPSGVIICLGDWKVQQDPLWNPLMQKA
jgi:hypothetical protein